MTNMEKLLDAMDDCGEAAIFYKGKKIMLANRLFAELLEIEQEKLLSKEKFVVSCR